MRLPHNSNNLAYVRSLRKNVTDAERKLWYEYLRPCPYKFTRQKSVGPYILGQHRTIPALRLKHRSGGCGTASALPKCSIRLQYYLRFWLSICRTSLAVSALRIMRYCP